MSILRWNELWHIFVLHEEWNSKTYMTSKKCKFKKIQMHECNNVYFSAFSSTYSIDWMKVSFIKIWISRENVILRNKLFFFTLLKFKIWCEFRIKHFFKWNKWIVGFKNSFNHICIFLQIKDYVNIVIWFPH